MLYAVFSGIAVLFLLCDQWLKQWTEHHLAPGQIRPLLGPILELQSVHNYGAAWSVLSGQRALLMAVTGGILLVVVFCLARGIVRHPLGLCASFLILAGGLGNLLDRMRLGYVVDMLHFPFWPSYPTFNIADVCVVSGCCLLLLYTLTVREPLPMQENDLTDAYTDTCEDAYEEYEQEDAPDYRDERTGRLREFFHHDQERTHRRKKKKNPSDR